MTNRRTRLALAYKLAACAACAVPALALAPAAPAGAQASARGDGVAAFYAARGGRPLWFAQPGAQTDALLQILSTSSIDGLQPRRYRISALQRAIRDARGGNPGAVSNAEMLLSQALVSYAQDLHRLPGKTIYVDRELDPSRQSGRSILEGAAAAKSFEAYVRNMGWMHPIYGQLRSAVLREGRPAVRQQLLTNLRRARELPNFGGRQVVVNAAAQRLYMYENGEVVDHMRVVAGKPEQPTPMMAAFLKFTSVNPYWYVPSDVAAHIMAPKVLKQGMGYLKMQGYQVLADGSDNPRILDPNTVDWKGVANGTKTVYLRQLPGPANSMGDKKFMFPNKQGIYLHDSPKTELFDESTRLLSAGCVRLQDADRLAKWLYGKPLKPQGRKPEQKVPVPGSVPVLLTYLTAVPSGTGVAYFDDLYGWDRQAMRRG